MKVAIVGSGNVATVLGKKISTGPDEVIQIVGRNEEKVKELACELKTEYTTNILQISPSADIYIISVSDEAIKVVAERLKFNNSTVVHTAAAVSKEVLAGSSDSYGVLYPLQTLRKEISSLPAIPILIDGNSDQTKAKLAAFVSNWTDNLGFADDEDRLRLHVAAVFVSNFTNHLFAVAERYCRANSFNYNLLLPLIKETMSRVGQYGPSEVQTGPAIRKDLMTIETHQKILQQTPGLLKLYNTLTDSIISFYRN